jgi:ligand-binding SRPBCC domain-containing protein
MTISAYDRPRLFRDELVRGPLRRLVHDHFFEPVEQRTLMHDVFEFSSGIPPLDAVVLRPHLRRLLLKRNEVIAQLAESDGWRDYLPQQTGADS